MALREDKVVRIFRQDNFPPSRGRTAFGRGVHNSEGATLQSGGVGDEQGGQEHRTRGRSERGGRVLVRDRERGLFGNRRGQKET